MTPRAQTNVEHRPPSQTIALQILSRVQVAAVHTVHHVTTIAKPFFYLILAGMITLNAVIMTVTTSLTNYEPFSLSHLGGALAQRASRSEKMRMFVI